MANTYLTRTNGTSTEQKIFTFSAWVKRSAISTSGDKVLMAEYTDGNNRMKLQFKDDDFFEVYQVDGGSVRTQVKTNRKFKDCSAWYHIVVACDNTQGTNTNRVKIYVNGEQETSFSIATYPYSSTIPNLNANSKTITIGNDDIGGNYFDGSMSHVHFVDGSALAPTVFGSTDSTTGEWKINTSPSYTVGNNGFFILKDGNSVTDQSANSNNFTVGGGTLTKTEDCPDNVFATLNRLAKPGTGNLPSFGNGNTHYNKTATGAGNNSQVNGTIGASSGKYYFELKQASNNPLVVGVSTVDTVYDSNGASLTVPSSGVGVGYFSNGQKFINGTASSYGNTWTTNDIIGVAFDLDNNYIYFSKNGTWENSGDPTSGGSGTGGLALTANVTYTPAVQNNGYNDTSSAYCNFGNGYFGTTAVSSAGTNASNNGIFEYDVPTGYTALSTKGLNL